MEEKIIAIVSRITKKDKEFLADNYDTIKLWDSLSKVEIVFELEETFNITFSTDEIAVMDCLSNIIDITKRKVS
jgi:acyl carrier protein